MRTTRRAPRRTPRRTPRRSGAHVRLVVAGLATLGAGAAAVATGGASSAEAGPPAGAAPSAVVARAATTSLTFKTNSCEGCRVQLFQAVRGSQDVWQSRAKKVRGGLVTFSFRTAHTHGLSAWVRPTWEGKDGGNPGYVTLAAFRYKSEAPGDPVSFHEARSKHRGSACWAGTDTSRVVLPLKVRKVTVQGNTGPTAGSIAWIGTTQEWWRPMLPASKGVLGAQDVVFCDQP